jgi:hypothetical protein
VNQRIRKSAGISFAVKEPSVHTGTSASRRQICKRDVAKSCKSNGPYLYYKKLMYKKS